MLKKELIKIHFVNAKTQFENAKTQKTAQVVAWTCLDRRTKKSPEQGRYLENWYLEADRDLGTSESDTEVGVL